MNQKFSSSSPFPSRLSRRIRSSGEAGECPQLLKPTHLDDRFTSADLAPRVQSTTSLASLASSHTPSLVNDLLTPNINFAASSPFPHVQFSSPLCVPVRYYRSVPAGYSPLHFPTSPHAPSSIPPAASSGPRSVPGRAPIRKFQCRFCFRDFTKRSDLSRHLNSVHLKLLQFACNKCDYTNTRQDHAFTHASREHPSWKPADLIEPFSASPGMDARAVQKYYEAETLASAVYVHPSSLDSPGTDPADPQQPLTLSPEDLAFDAPLDYDLDPIFHLEDPLE